MKHVAKYWYCRRGGSVHIIGVYDSFSKETGKLGNLIGEFESPRIADAIRKANDFLSNEQKLAIKEQARSGSGAIYSSEGKYLSSY